MHIDWNEETKTTTARIEIGGNVFEGIATCHEDDYDMCSEKVGAEIAVQRATIAYLRHVRDNELKPALGALKQLYYSASRSKEYNPRGYEAKMLYRAIQRYEEDIEAVKDEIKSRQKYIKDYISLKDTFYKKLRRMRLGQN